MIMDSYSSNDKFWQDIDPKSRKITVCSSCLRASCFQGEFYCEDYRVAGTVEKNIYQLEELNLEDKHYWY